jgi:hypothetical protein
MKILILNRKLKEGEKITLLTDSTPDNWRGENGEKIVELIVEGILVKQSNGNRFRNRSC